jgi:hypothetical protein
MDAVQKLGTDPFFQIDYDSLGAAPKDRVRPLFYAFCVCACFATEYAGFSAASPTGGRHKSAALKEDKPEK